jgi:hypothetical protein
LRDQGIFYGDEGIRRSGYQAAHPLEMVSVLGERHV